MNLGRNRQEDVCKMSCDNMYLNKALLKKLHWDFYMFLKDHVMAHILFLALAQVFCLVLRQNTLL